VTTWDKECKPKSLSKPAVQPSGNTIMHILFLCPKEVKDLSIASSLFYDLDETHAVFQTGKSEKSK